MGLVTDVCELCVSVLDRVIRNVMEHQPKLHYLLAVDESNNTMEDIVKVRISLLNAFQM